MKTIFMLKMPGGNLVPASEHDRELLSDIPAGQPVRMQFTRPRNYEFHKKFFALVDYLYDCWEPEFTLGQHKLKPEKNKERFRKDLIILAGYYEATYRVDGSVRVEAKSISFGSMSEEEFSMLYNACIDAGLKHILTNHDEAELRAVLEAGLMEFA